MKKFLVIAVLGSAVPGVSGAVEANWNLPAPSDTGGRGDAYSAGGSAIVGGGMEPGVNWNLPAPADTGGRGDAYSDVKSSYRTFPDIKTFGR